MNRIQYEEIKKTYLDSIQCIADGWRIKQSNNAIVSELYNIENSDYKYSSFIMDEYKNTSAILIKTIIIKLLTDYKFDYEDTTKELKYITKDVDKQNRFYIFIKQDNTLYIFKEFGISSHVNVNSLGLPEYYNKVKYKYISYVDENAWAEDLNHNNDLNDESRGTNIYSIKYFFNKHFDSDEYKKFVECISEYKNTFCDYLGLTMTRVLQPNVLFDFNEIVIHNLITHPYELILEDENKNDVLLSDDNKNLLNNEFMNNRNYKILLGDKDFAKSFITAEWLYNSLEGAKNIDFSAIALGYLKSVEQFLFMYVGLHINEKDGKNRKILKKYTDNGAPIYDDLTDEYLNEKKDLITLGSLTNFISNRRNRDLYKEFVNDDIAKYIKSMAHKVKEDRNNHLHRDNIQCIEEVKRIKDDVYMFFYIMFTCFEFDEDEIYNVFKKEKENELDKLYNYLYKNAKRKNAEIEKQLDDDYLKESIYYLHDNETEYGPYVAKKYHDEKDFGKRKIRFEILKIALKGECPSSIEKEFNDFKYVVIEKTLLIDRHNPFNISISKDYLKIFDGKDFLL